MSRSAASMVVPSPEVRLLIPVDGIRGLAILMVMMTHSTEVNYSHANRAIKLLGVVFFTASSAWTCSLYSPAF